MQTEQRTGMRGHRIQGPAHAEARRRAILLAAARCFARRGYDATTLDHIAAELGITKGLIYYYFTGKEEIYAEIRATAIADALARLERITAAGGPPEYLLARAVRDLVKHIFQGLDQYANVLHEPHALGAQNRRRLRELGRRYERAIEALIREGIARGVFYPGLPRLMTYTLLRATLGVASWYAPEGPLQPEAIAAGVTRQVLAGVLRAGNEAADALLAAVAAEDTASVTGRPSATSWSGTQGAKAERGIKDRCGEESG